MSQQKSQNRKSGCGLPTVIWALVFVCGFALFLGVGGNLGSGVSSIVTNFSPILQVGDNNSAIVEVYGNRTEGQNSPIGHENSITQQLEELLEEEASNEWEGFGGEVLFWAILILDGS